MKGLRSQDYVVAAVIIIGVLAAWFIGLAGLMRIIDPQLALPLVVVICLMLYVIVKRRQPKA